MPDENPFDEYVCKADEELHAIVESIDRRIDDLTYEVRKLLEELRRAKT